MLVKIISVVDSVTKPFTTYRTIYRYLYFLVTGKPYLFTGTLRDQLNSKLHVNIVPLRSRKFSVGVTKNCLRSLLLERYRCIM
jgi:hypothetical protein